MRLTFEEFAFLKEYRLLRKQNKFRFNHHRSNPLLVTRFRRFIVRKQANNGLDVTASERF